MRGCFGLGALVKYSGRYWAVLCVLAVLGGWFRVLVAKWGKSVGGGQDVRSGVSLCWLIIVVVAWACASFGAIKQGTDRHSCRNMNLIVV